MLWSLTLEKNLGSAAHTPDMRLKVRLLVAIMVMTRSQGRTSPPHKSLNGSDGRDHQGWRKVGLFMAHKHSSDASSASLAQLGQEILYVGVDIGKRGHVGGFLSTTLLARHRRFEHCPALSFENSREGFHTLVERIQAFVSLTQVQVLLEVTGHYHRALMQYRARSWHSGVHHPWTASGQKGCSKQINETH